MPTSIVEKPHSYENGITIGSDSYDAINIVNANRHLHGGAGSASSVIFSGNSSASDKGIRFYNYFNSLSGGSPIPAGSNILGIEIVAPNTERIWTSGGSFGNAWWRVYVHNGTSYSDPIEWDSSASYSGWTFSDSDRKAEVTGNTKAYKNNSSGEDVLFGAADDLHGLSWDVNDQEDWGIAVVAGHNGGANTAVTGIERGMGMRVTYEAGGATTKTVSGISTPSKVLDLSSTTSIINVT